jgi:proteasome accessory factor C
MAAPKFLQRIARLPEVLNLLAAYPGGLPLRDLAAQFDVEVETLRQDLVTYLELESWGWSFDIFRRPAIEFVQPEPGYGTDGSGGTLVRIVSDGSPGLGVEHLSAGDLAVLYTAGAALLDVEPDDSDLAEALGVIAETMYGEPSSVPRVGDWNRFLRELQDAHVQRRKVGIVYSRAWRQGVTERVIEPLRLVQTRRGWEVDAGPIGSEGNLRTFILANIRSADVLDETFEPPVGVDSLLERQRKTTTVRLELSQDGRWAARQYAERVTVIEEDEASVTVDLELLPPVGERVGLIMLASGTATKVIFPGSVLPEALGVIEELLQHHTRA